ncbi:hypothetical protein LR48_Vigan08g038200 [Vigna angularis]|uniref:Uncharacterized protein n=1 Tax=Phaseolus angularis TaxID=3914 RepID=A0A0L9V3B8_PHAAN|nr:hypothetical protein LR48_Vigan08g038200 [Vigna angularis]
MSDRNSFSTTCPIGQMYKTVDWRQQLNAHECVVNEVTVIVEYLKCALKAIKRSTHLHDEEVRGERKEKGRSEKEECFRTEVAEAFPGPIQQKQFEYDVVSKGKRWEDGECLGMHHRVSVSGVVREIGKFFSKYENGEVVEVRTTSNEEVVPLARLHTVHLTSVEVVHPKNDVMVL